MFGLTGVIHHLGTSRFTQGKTLNVHITREYMPVLSITVFYISRRNGVVSDTLSLQVDYDCDTRVNTTYQYTKRRVTLGV